MHRVIEEEPAPPQPYPVRVIDDHELFSATLTMALRNEGLDARQLPVADVYDFVSEPLTDRVGLVVLDLDLDRDADGHYVHGADLVKGLRAAGWKVLVVSGGMDQRGTASAIAAGAIGTVPKSRSFDVLLSTVLIAAGGLPVMSEAEHQDWLERHFQYQAQERELSRRLSRLSHREREVLELLAGGMRAAAIAEHFVVSMPTVRSQIRSLLAKLDVGSQLEAVALLRQAPTRTSTQDEAPR
ncbi:LuxR C-terminal-related transcriptional regulator [Actinomycetospora cinnamomea]|uniref:DNA-binding NarL/FixJ family response regulator n=1 Tax=Actinomycetospora cinnamomea TaxID=663609 RepID=A0A2U1EXE0_9PSEU|nr:LuxR C-terminal-related transcriptional regulator [Actinomycetospora cinnamomea]PVZ04597.1 DNA-binding NarL/FixJ family response regulator [Actinomycetospora cinnamomea]